MVLKDLGFCIWLSLLGAKIIGISLKDKNPKNHLNLVKKKISIKNFLY